MMLSICSFLLILDFLKYACAEEIIEARKGREEGHRGIAPETSDPLSYHHMFTSTTRESVNAHLNNETDIVVDFSHVAESQTGPHTGVPTKEYGPSVTEFHRSSHWFRQPVQTLDIPLFQVHSREVIGGHQNELKGMAKNIFGEAFSKENDSGVHSFVHRNGLPSRSYASKFEIGGRQYVESAATAPYNFRNLTMLYPFSAKSKRKAGFYTQRSGPTQMSPPPNPKRRSDEERQSNLKQKPRGRQRGIVDRVLMPPGSFYERYFKPTRIALASGEELSDPRRIAKWNLTIPMRRVRRSDYHPVRNYGARESRSERGHRKPLNATTKRNLPDILKGGDNYDKIIRSSKETDIYEWNEGEPKSPMQSVVEALSMQKSEGEGHPILKLPSISGSEIKNGSEHYLKNDFQELHLGSTSRLLQSETSLFATALNDPLESNTKTKETRKPSVVQSSFSRNATRVESSGSAGLFKSVREDFIQVQLLGQASDNLASADGEDRSGKKENASGHHRQAETTRQAVLLIAIGLVALTTAALVGACSAFTLTERRKRTRRPTGFDGGVFASKCAELERDGEDKILRRASKEKEFQKDGPSRESDRYSNDDFEPTTSDVESGASCRESDFKRDAVFRMPGPGDVGLRRASKLQDGPSRPLPERPSPMGSPWDRILKPTGSFDALVRDSDGSKSERQEHESGSLDSREVDPFVNHSSESCKRKLREIREQDRFTPEMNLSAKDSMGSPSNRILVNVKTRAAVFCYVPHRSSQGHATPLPERCSRIRLVKPRDGKTVARKISLRSQ